MGQFEQKGLVVPCRASVPPLPGVFQQAHCTPGKASRPMYAPAIAMHHEGNGFDLLFLVQALSSFLFYIQLAASNSLSEEKQATCMQSAFCLMQSARSRAGYSASDGAV